MASKTRTVEKEMARLAATSHGVVTRKELLRAGVTVDEIAQRLRRGSLIREFRGVYRVGHRAPSIEATYLASVRACGDGSLLCGRAAAYLLRLIRGSIPAPEVMAQREREVPGVLTHRCRQMDPRDAAVLHKVPLTTVPRTLVDLAAVLTIRELSRACHEADVLWGTKPTAVESVLARRPKSSGVGKLRLVLFGGEAVTLSELERVFLELLRANGLPLPEMNKVAGSHRVDCRWPEYRLTVELDSYRYHNTRHAWEQDRRREREGRARGDVLKRFTYGDVVEDPGYVIGELRVLLAHRPG